MSASLLSTKFYIPRARPGVIARPRLTEKLLELLDRPGSFALISGPAGSGKTTLLSEWISEKMKDEGGRMNDQPGEGFHSSSFRLHPSTFAWVSLDEGDNDPARFWTYLITACQSVQAGLGEEALALLRLNPQALPDETIPTLLINELSALNGDLILVLDDFHTIHNESIHSALAYLLDHLPGNLHLVLSTRIDPAWPLARFRARDQLVELRAANLRFTPDEATEFLKRTPGLNLSPEQVAALEARTEGWAAGLQLAALSMIGRSDIEAFVKAFTGSHTYVAEYLLEEVLGRQPQAVQAFLLETSILERLCAELCDAVIENRDWKLEISGQSLISSLYSQQILDHLLRSNLFILPLDDEGRWYRYHHLFADLLQARLRRAMTSEAVADLHRRAAAWYEGVGMAQEAVEHALAGADYTHAITLIEKIALPMILQAQVKPVDRWLQAFPSEYLPRSPRVDMAFAWMHLLRGTSPQAAAHLERLDAFFSTPGAGGNDPSLQGEWLALKCKLLTMQGKAAESREMAERALQILPASPEHAHIRSMVLVNLATAYQQMLDYDRAAEVFHLIVRDAQAAGDYVSETLGTSGRAQMLLLQGRLHLAYEVASEGIKRLEACGKTTPFSATLYGELGQIHYYWRQLDQAQGYFERSIQKSGRSGYSDPEIYRHVVLARMYQDEDWAASDREMQKAVEIAQASPPAMIREEVISQQVRVYLAFDRPAAAQELLEAEGFRFEDELRFPGLAMGPQPITHPAGLLYNSALRILLLQARRKHDLERLNLGIELASEVLSGELQCRHLPAALETLLLRSQLYAALGDEQKSLTEAYNAVELAEPEGFISPFIEAGPPAAEALAALLKRDLPGTTPSNRPERTAYIRRILAAYPKTGMGKAAPGEQAPTRPHPPQNAASAEESLALIEPLTGRELEVLQLIAAGDSNGAIAEKLVITVSAVKKHTGNIFGKLGVSSRTQAVARARWLGLLEG
jgi:LuxR family maltose regulon positive regulatory protein